MIGSHPARQTGGLAGRTLTLEGVSEREGAERMGGERTRENEREREMALSPAAAAVAAALSLQTLAVHLFPFIHSLSGGRGDDGGGGGGC